MKILQTSNIQLGRAFSGTGFPGDKLRAGIKSTFTKIIDTAIEQKVDLVILAGDTFANIDISQNLIDLVVNELKRLEKIHTVIIPGSSDRFEKESFWAGWQISPPTENIHILAENKSSTVEITDKSIKIYGYLLSRDGDELPENVKGSGEFKHHVAVVYDDIETAGEPEDQQLSPLREKLFNVGFDYIALGGRNEAVNFVDMGLKAAYSGSPVTFAPELEGAGYFLMINLDGESIKVDKISVGEVVWRQLEIPMDTVANVDDLKTRILESAGDNVLLRVSLTGLALLEAGLNINQLREELEDYFLNIEFADKTSVLPDNISGIKVQEKTVMGQYLKLMIGKLNNSESDEKKDLEESLKVGYTLLSGREPW
ncbi:MAG: metallophosphoesterase [candidate division Zixibacteria bacterium]